MTSTKYCTSVFSISFERCAHSQNAPPIYLSEKAESTYTSYKALTVQTSIKLAGGSACQPFEVSIFRLFSLQHV